MIKQVLLDPLDLVYCLKKKLNFLSVKLVDHIDSIFIEIIQFNELPEQIITLIIFIFEYV